MKLLDAVNTVLPFMGEHPVTTVESSRHPTVDLIVAAIDRHRLTMLSEGYWFNEETHKILVNTDGRINVPETALAVSGIDCDVNIEGEYFYDVANHTFQFTKPITVKLSIAKPFEHLPYTFAMLLTYKAGVDVYTADFGVESAIQVMNSRVIEYGEKLHQEELNHRRYNGVRQTVRRLRGYNLYWR